MKKIAIICNYKLLPERVGGMDRFFWLFNQQCKELSYQIDWFFPNVSTYGSYSELNIIAPEDRQSLESKFIQFSESQTQKYDVVITHFLELCTSFSKKVKLQNSKTKFIAIDHNPRPINGYSLKKKVEKKIKGLLYASYTNLFVGVSDYTRKNILLDFGNHLNKKTIVVYNGIEIDKYKVRENRASMHPTFLVACHLRESKGIQDLIEAVHLLPNDIKTQLSIDIYGGGEYQSHLEFLISNYNLKNNFNFKGSVNNLYTIYFQYDYLLQPTHMECFSLSILESLSANVPVITTSVGGNEEAITHGKNGYIFQPKNILALKEIIQKVFEGNLAISENTRTLISTNFTIEKMVKEHINLI